MKALPPDKTLAKLWLRREPYERGGGDGYCWKTKGWRGITHGLVEDRVWLSLFTSPARETQPLIVMEDEKDMDLLISNKLDMNFSHEGKCDPAHRVRHPRRREEPLPGRGREDEEPSAGLGRRAQRAAAQVPTQVPTWKPPLVPPGSRLRKSTGEGTPSASPAPAVLLWVRCTGLVPWGSLVPRAGHAGAFCPSLRAVTGLCLHSGACSKVPQHGNALPGLVLLSTASHPAGIRGTLQCNELLRGCPCLRFPLHQELMGL